MTELMKCKKAACSSSLLHAATEASICGKKTQLLVKNNIPKQHGERKVENLKHTLHTVGALSFKTCHRSFSLENAVSLTSSHAAEPCCITMTQECPSVKEIFTEQQLTGGGEGRGKRRGGIVQGGEGELTKGNPITPGHGSSTSQQREIHHLQDQTETCAQGKAQ